MKERIISLALSIALLFSEFAFTYAGSIQETSASYRFNQCDQKEISWKLNSDGTYTLTNNMGSENSLYAWYVIENENLIEKTQYTEDPSFTYDFNDNDELVVKGFVRNINDESKEYDQKSYKITSSVILSETVLSYAISEIKIPDNIDELLDYGINEVLTNNTILAEKILQGDGSEWEVDLTIPVDWNCPNVTLRSYGFKVNSLYFLDDAWNHFRGGELEYGTLIAEYLLDWARQNTQYEEGTWQWHDDATASRVFRFACFYKEIQDYYTTEEKQIIEESIKYQIDLLASDFFYTNNHNHGMHQDIALFTAALLYEDGLAQNKHIELALSRLGSYYDYVYTEDGVHKEHSPFYARDTLISMEFLVSLVNDISPEFVLHIREYIDGASDYLIQLIKPDGNWPSIGDSSPANGLTTLKDLLSNNDNYAYLATGVGAVPSDDVVFEKGGYAIFRSSWDDAPDDATWMLFNCATHSSTHKHGDDLELLLYHKGDFLIEAGKRNYNYSDKETAWAYSGYAHNVLIVNDDAYPVKTSQNGFQAILPDALNTRITDYDISDHSNPMVSGYENRFGIVEQTRTVTYHKENKEVIVEDMCIGTKDYDGTLLWHIAEGIDVKKVENGWNFYRGKELIGRITFESDTEIDVNVIGNSGEFPYMTWIFDGKDNPRYGSLLKVNFQGNAGKVSIITRIDLK